MPGLSGLDVLARLKTERVESRVIVLTMHQDPDLATDAIRGGASGFLLKESAGDELLAAVRYALEGKVYMSPSVTRDVMERLASPTTPKEPQLTSRQRDILRLIVKGQRMKEIAANLGLSTAHRGRVQVRDDGNSRGHLDRGAGKVRARPPNHAGLNGLCPPGNALP